MRRLSRDFFARDTLTVARELLGQRLVRIVEGERLCGRIVESEAYVGEADEACHASCGRTARNAVMYGPPGHAYVYLIYGIHHCLNTVTVREGYPAAVLIRALEPVEGLDRMRMLRGGRPDRELTNGPGKLCQALAIDLDLNGADLCASNADLFLEYGDRVDEGAVRTGPRVGIRGDEAAMAAPWRFYLANNSHVSG
ncbi:MAG: DNA-3-methyladenine glycosylase [Anaerolineae bacterium]|jgi:DNA-3-methyladenine glycosylase